MDEIGEERVMTRFLLGALDAAERERVLDRLEAEPSYFEEMAATEDDLILRYHHRQLSAEDGALFADAYLRSPARRARVDETLALMEAGKAWKAGEAVSPWRAVLEWSSGALDWLAAPFQVPRFALVGLSVAAVLLAGYAGRNLTPAPGAGRIVTFATTLTAVGEKGPGAAAGIDRMPLPPGTVEIQPSFQIVSPQSGEQFAAELEALDGGTAAQPSSLLLELSGTGATVTVTIAAPPDGDYVLRLRRVAGGPPEVVAAHAFRVKRVQPPAGR